MPISKDNVEKAASRLDMSSLDSSSDEVETDLAADRKVERSDIDESENKRASVSVEEDLESRQPTYVSPLSANEILRADTGFQANARPHFIPKLEPLSKKVEELRKKMDEEVRFSEL